MYPHPIPSRAFALASPVEGEREFQTVGIEGDICIDVGNRCRGDRVRDAVAAVVGDVGEVAACVGSVGGISGADVPGIGLGAVHKAPVALSAFPALGEGQGSGLVGRAGELYLILGFGFAVVHGDSGRIRATGSLGREHNFEVSIFICRK